MKTEKALAIISSCYFFDERFIELNRKSESDMPVIKEYLELASAFLKDDSLLELGELTRDRFITREASAREDYDENKLLKAAKFHILGTMDGSVSDIPLPPELCKRAMFSILAEYSNKN